MPKSVMPPIDFFGEWRAKPTEEEKARRREANRALMGEILLSLDLNFPAKESDGKHKAEDEQARNDLSTYFDKK